MFAFRSPWSLAVLLVLASCSSRPKGGYSDAEIRESVYLHYARKLNDSKMKKRVHDSSYSLVRATYPEFLVDLDHRVKGRAYLDALPRGLSHGDFHPLQTSIRNGVATLEDWDTVKRNAPLWIDVVRMESAARVLAQEEGLRGYAESSCVDAYAERMASESSRREAFRPTPYKEDNYPDFSKHPVWQNAEDASAIPEDLRLAFVAWIGTRPDLSFTAAAPMKRLKSGTGSYLFEKIIVLDPAHQLWEMKEVEARPGDCESYAELAKVFERLDGRLGPNPVRACWNWNGRSFTLLKWENRYWSASKEDFRSAAALASHVAWSCERLAEFHLAGLSEGDARAWRLAWLTEAPLRTRLRQASEQLFRGYQDGYRLILSDGARK